jgi:hypothetical protein
VRFVARLARVRCKHSTLLTRPSAPALCTAVWLERRYQGIRIEFVAEGVIGHPDALKAFNSLLNAFVVVLIAIALTDFTAQYLSDEFASEKYEDDGERAQLDTLLEKEAVSACKTLLCRSAHSIADGAPPAQDHGVPFNFEDLRLRQANGELSDECYEARQQLLRIRTLAHLSRC